MNPLTASDARKLLNECLAAGRVVLTDHATEEAANDGLSEDQVWAVLVRGDVGEAYERAAQWRHVVALGGVSVVITFDWTDAAIVVTVWRG